MSRYICAILLMLIAGPGLGQGGAATENDDDPKVRIEAKTPKRAVEQKAIQDRESGGGAVDDNGALTPDADKPPGNEGPAVPPKAPGNDSPTYPPKPPGSDTKDEQPVAGGSGSHRHQGDEFEDKWYYELTAAVALNVFESMLDRGVPPAPEVRPISTRAKGPPTRVPDEIVLVSESIAEADRLQIELARYNLTLKRRESLTNIGIVTSVFKVPEKLSVPDAIDLVRKLFPDVWLDENQIYRFMDDTVFYPRRAVGWPTRDSVQCARDLKIGLVDTGVDVSHPALARQQIVRRQFTIPGVEIGPADHGTALAILLVGSAEYPEHAGLLPDATLYIAESFNIGGKRGTPYTTTDLVARSLDWLAGEDVRVINLSFGGPRNLVVELVIHKLLHRGFSIVAAAGNGGADGPPMYPAAQNGVYAVTAVDQRSHLYRSATRGDYIDFAAPGVDIWTGVVTDTESNHRGRYRSGTSYAAPYVTGIIALLSYSGDDAWSFLTDNAIDLGKAGKDPEFGWGLVQNPFTCT